MKRSKGKCVGLSPVTEFSHSLFAKHLDLRLQGAFLHIFTYQLCVFSIEDKTWNILRCVKIFKT